MASFRVALVGEYRPSVVAHKAIPEAFRLSGASIELVWVSTESVEESLELAEFDGIWCVPGSPYASLAGALEAIRFARENDKPFLGSCGGFQHLLLEYAQNVAGLPTPRHEETDPEEPNPLISRLSCSLTDVRGEIVLTEGTRIREAYGTATITEGYHCRYGLNPIYAQTLFDHGLRPTAYDSDGDLRAVELPSHRFFVGTLFQSERRALTGEVPPLVSAFIKAMGT